MPGLTPLFRSLWDRSLSMIITHGERLSAYGKTSLAVSQIS